MPDDNWKTMLEAHGVVAGYARQVENRAWTALYNFLTGNSILILAWAALYTRTKAPMENCGADTLLLALAFVGLFLSLGWSSFGARNCAYNASYAEQLERIERNADWMRNQLLPRSELVRKDIQGRGVHFFPSFQPLLLVGTPLFFSVIYVWMCAIVMVGSLKAASWIVALAVIAAVATCIWAIVDCWKVVCPKKRAEIEK